MVPNVHSKLCEASQIGLFAKMMNAFLPLTVFAKNLHYRSLSSKHTFGVVLLALSTELIHVERFSQTVSWQVCCA